MTPLTQEQVLALPASVPLVTAGQALGLTRAQTYDLNRTGNFPATVLKVGSRYIVPRRQLLNVLGLDGDDGNDKAAQESEALLSELSALRTEMLSALASWDRRLQQACEVRRTT